MPWLTEKGVYLWTGLIIAFLAITFSKDLALVYLAIIILDYILYSEYNQPLTINSVPGNTGKSLMTGAVAYALFMVISIMTMTVLQYGAVQESPTEAFFRAQWQASANPIFADNPIVLLLAFGLAIPVLETRLTARLYNILANTFRIPASVSGIWELFAFRRNWKLWAIFSVLGIGAVLFHLQAKGVTDNPALILTFAFWVFTGALMAYTKEAESAIWMHILNNGITVLRQVFHVF